MANYEDLKMALLRRSKIEQWVDEPFFKKTMIGAFVRVGINKREVVIAEVRDIKDDENAMYNLTNGKKTGKYLQLLITEEDKMKWYKINQTSNQEIQYQDFERMVQCRQRFSVQQVNKEMTFLKMEDIKEARTYTYKQGELEKIVQNKFERALRKKDLSEFPNVTYFQKMKLNEKASIEQSIVEAQGDKMIKALEEKLATITEDLKCIDDHLKKDLRVTRFNNSSGNRLLVDNIEKMEDDKIYAEWLDNQQKQNELEKQRKLMTEQDNTTSLNLKESLFFEIKKILEQQALGQFKGGSSQGINSYYERM